MGTYVSSYINTSTKEVHKDAICYWNFNGCTNIELYNIFIEKEKRFYPLEEIYEYFEYLKRAGVKIDKYFEDENQCIQVRIGSTNEIERIIASTVIRYLWDGKYSHPGYKVQDYYCKIYEHFMNLCRYFPEKDFFKLLLFATNLFGTGRRYLDTNHCIIGSREGTRLLSYEELAKSSNINSMLRCDRFGFFEDINIRDKYATKEDYQNAFDIYNQKLILKATAEKI